MKSYQNGVCKPEFTFEPKEHDAIGTNLDAMDFPRAAKVSGARFVILYDQLVRLERALANFMLDTHRTRVRLPRSTDSNLSKRADPLRLRTPTEVRR